MEGFSSLTLALPQSRKSVVKAPNEAPPFPLFAPVKIFIFSRLPCPDSLRR